MIDDSKRIVTALSAILPTYLELFLDSNTPIPCISYFGYNNIDDRVGDSIFYSRVSYMIKVWGKDYKELISNTELVDTTMKSLGYRRESCTDLKQDYLLCKVLIYKGLAYEDTTTSEQ